MPARLIDLCKAGASVLLNEGAHSFLRKSISCFRGSGSAGVQQEQDYLEWISRNEPSEQSLQEQSALARGFRYRPLFSIVMPVWNTEPAMLRAALDSVRNQTYDNWELCIAEGNSSKKHVKRILAEYLKCDERMRIRFLPKNHGISGNSNEALALATGEFIALMDHDDELAPFALYEIAALLNINPELDYIYSDEDKIDVRGVRYQPFFKPDWSPDYLMACGYTNHFSVYRKSLVDEVGGFRESCSGSQDYDLVLRCTERTIPQRIGHIPKVLYHWRQIPDSTAGDPYAKDGLVIRTAKLALADAMTRRNIKADVVDGSWPGSYRIIRKSNAQPLVSIIVPTKDKVGYLRRCLDSLESITSYRRYEVLIVDNNSVEEATRVFLRNTRHTVLLYESSFNFSKINNMAVKKSKGDVLVFLNNDIEVITPDWVQNMLEYALDPEIGPVGAKLLYPDQSVQHAGVVLGMSPDQETGVAGHVFGRFAPHDPGYFGGINVVRNCSAVTAAAMMIRKETFCSVGGFDEDLAVCYNDVDLCLRLGAGGYRTVYTPYAVFIHHESISRGCHVDRGEAEFMIERWGEKLKTDPYYSRNLCLTSYDCRIKV